MSLLFNLVLWNEQNIFVFSLYAAADSVIALPYPSGS